jgi:uncharacterized protein YdhG (YjbR/CyaY superfamily)
VSSPIEDHLARFDGVQRHVLETVCGVIRKALPGAEEAISYGMPAFKVDGTAVIALEGFKEHNSLFPYGAQIIEAYAEELSGYSVSKGTIQFALDTPFPAPLLKKILRTRIAAINATYPKKSGETKEFYDNGCLKMRGKVKATQKHGYWEWFRRDGSLMRSGAFKEGEQVGEWTTYDRSGAPVKVTQFG